MASVADDYPAREQADGLVWFRPVRRDGESMSQWGWTADPRQAHPDYEVKIGDDGTAVTWRNDPWAPAPKAEPVVLNEPRCVNCNRTQCDGGPTCVPETPDCPADPIVHVITMKGSDDMTQLATDGTEVEEQRFTQWSRYPLPPAPPRFKVVYDGYGRYKLPSPSTGRPTAFSRATTIADTLDETYNLNRWKRRNAVKAIMAAIDSPVAAESEAFDTAGGDPIGDALACIREAIMVEDDRALDNAVDLLDNLTGGRDAAELGEAVHAWLEAVDVGTVLPADVPDMFKPYVAAYRDALRRAGLIALPQYVERIVLNDRGEETIAGTIDRIFLVVTTGELIMGDVKTSKTLEYGWLTYSVQVGGVYGFATKMMAADGSGWEPMPEVGQKYAIILHVPSDQPERSAAVTIDMWFGGETMITSLETRRRRKAAPKAVPFVHEIPVPTKDALRYVEARDALLDITYVGDLPGVYENYEDVWTDDLTELGHHVAQLFNNADATA